VEKNILIWDDNGDCTYEVVEGGSKVHWIKVTEICTGRVVEKMIMIMMKEKMTKTNLSVMGFL